MQAKQILHHAMMRLSQPVSRLLPDKVPATFVGPHALGELCQSIESFGLRKILVVTDATLEKIGIVESVCKALSAAGLEYSVYAGVLPDPTTDQVEAGFAQFQAEHCDAVVALGGGSPMDAAKLIAALATSRKTLRQLEGKLKIKSIPAPLFAIPTTAGTGSEVTIVAVASDPESHQKRFFIDPKLLPGMVALDPSIMTGLPRAITAATGMDALTHAVESFLSLASSPQTESYSTTAVRLIFQHLPAAYQDGENLAARKAMCLAAYYAGLAFTRTSVGYVHAIAHSFGAHYATPHGLANATALPHVLAYSKATCEAPLAELARVIGKDAGSQSERAQQFINAVRELMKTLEIEPQLKELKEQDIPTIAKQATSEAYLNYPVPRYMDASACEVLLRQMLP